VCVVWYRKRLAESEATAVAISRVAWGLDSCYCRPDRWLWQFAVSGLPGVCSSLTSILPSSTCHPQPPLSHAVRFCFFLAIDSLILTRAICLIASGHYQPRWVRGVCKVLTWDVGFLKHCWVREWEMVMNRYPSAHRAFPPSTMLESCQVYHTFIMTWVFSWGARAATTLHGIAGR